MASQEGNEEMNSSSTPETELDDNILCSPCDSDGRKLKSVGYCVNCKEYLCETCFKYHQIPTVTRKHVLLDQKQMGNVEKGNNRCPEHEKRDIEYHCPKHAFFGCHVCFFKHQSNNSCVCKDSIYIPDVPETLVQEKLKEFNGKVDALTQKTNGVSSEVQRTQAFIKRRSTEIMSAIKSFKLHVIDSVEKLEKDLIKKVEGIGEKERNKSKAVARKSKEVHATVEAISTEIDILRNRNDNTNLYIAILRAESKLKSLEDDPNEVDSGHHVKTFTFEANTNLTEILKTPWGLGKLADSSAVSSVDHVSDIKAKSSEDSKECCVSGAALMPGGKLVIGDLNNKNVKIIDTRQHKVVSELKLSNSPWSVAKETDFTVAVTVPDDKKIVFVRTDPTLGVDRELGVKEKCYGVACCKGKLVLGFCNPHKVKVMNSQGTVFREIQNHDNGEALFNYPEYIALNLEQNLVYVSNYFGEQKVICTQLDGTVVATYSCKDFTIPQQAVVLGTGMIFVTGTDSKNVHQITPDCKKVKVILSSSEGLVEPRAISYNEDKRRLYVGDKNYIKVYKVTYEDM